MALSQSDLKNDLKTAMFEIRGNTAQTELWNTIKNHVLNNMEINGAYTGMIPGSPPVPDPANGPYTWDTMAILGQPVMNPPNFAAWLLGLRTNFVGTSFKPKSNDEQGTVTSVTPVLLLPTFAITQDGQKHENEFDLRMEQIATAIVAGLTTCGISPPPSGGFVATSINGGIGVVVFTNCI